MAAGLAAMVAGMSRGKKAYAAFDAELAAALAKLGTLREEMKTAIDVDAASYQSVVAAYKAQKTARPQECAAGVAEALRGATGVPLRVAEASVELVVIVEALRAITNPKMASDLTVAVALARAAAQGALANVEINLGSLEPGTEAGFILDTQAKVAQLRKSLG
jgi:glutamate formiminotransferase/formiminotetrahydrofolate cyclodeaminase